MAVKQGPPRYLVGEACKVGVTHTTHTHTLEFTMSATATKVADNGKSTTVNPSQHLVISAPNLKLITFKIRGTSPYVQNKFSNKAKQMMKAKQEAGSQAKKGTKRDAKNFQECYEEAQYKPAGTTWKTGAIPATSIKAAMVAACRLCDFKMTDAKQCVYVKEDGFDRDELVPLIRIAKGQPEYFEQAVRNETGVADIRARPKWDAGWECNVTIEYDADRFGPEDVANLLLRAGTQVGIGEGRPASRKCVGLGWGRFEIVGSSA